MNENKNNYKMSLARHNLILLLRKLGLKAKLKYPNNHLQLIDEINMSLDLTVERMDKIIQKLRLKVE